MKFAGRYVSALTEEFQAPTSCAASVAPFGAVGDARNDAVVVVDSFKIALTVEASLERSTA